MRYAVLVALLILALPVHAAEPDYCATFKAASDEENKNKGVPIGNNVKAGESVVDCTAKTVVFHKIAAIEEDKLKPEWRVVKLDEFNKSVCADKESVDAIKQGWSFSLQFDFPKDKKVMIKAACG